jgi:TPR repeat protein
MLLVVGGSASGKSRSTAEAVRDRLPDHRLLRVQAGRLAELVEAPLAEVAPALVWLDDVQLFAHQAFRGTLKRLLDAGAVVVGTIRRAELDVLDVPGDLRDRTGDALSDQTFVKRVNWRTTWSADELGRLKDHVHSQALIAAAAAGTPPGAYCVGGPALVRRLKNAQEDEDHPGRYWLVRTVLDWHRAGMRRLMPTAEAMRLAMARAYPTGGAKPHDLDDALTEALRGEFTGPPAGRPPALLIMDSQGQSVGAHDYVLDYEQQHSDFDVPGVVWDCAIAHASDDERFAISMAASYAHQADKAMAAITPLAEAGDLAAMYLGWQLLLRNGDPVAARKWYKRAAKAGHTNSMTIVGELLWDSDPVAARKWYEGAAKAGDTTAMNNLGVLLKDSDPVAARKWYKRAAKTGDVRAMNNLGLLLKDSYPVAARKWYKRAAKTGHTDAMNNLGVLLKDSNPVAARK